MQTRISTKGQIVLPGQVRRTLGLRTGDSLDITVEPAESRIVLTLRNRRPSVVIGTDAITGFPVLTLHPSTCSESVPSLTNREIEEILADFP